MIGSRKKVNAITPDLTSPRTSWRKVSGKMMFQNMFLEDVVSPWKTFCIISLSMLLKQRLLARDHSHLDMLFQDRPEFVRSSALNPSLEDPHYVLSCSL